MIVSAGAAGVVRIFQLALSAKASRPQSKPTYTRVETNTSTFEDREEIEQMYNRPKKEVTIDRSKYWKRVHGDVFRKPPKFLWFTVLIGTGIQASFMSLTSLVCSVFADAQAMTGLLAVFLPLYGFLNGYIASVYYRFFKGSHWVKLSLSSALLFPGLLTLAYLCVLLFDSTVANRLIGGSGVSLWTLAYLWCFMNLPSTAIGALGGFMSEELKTPVKANRVRRMIPEQPNMLKQKIYILVLGFFTALTIERQFQSLQSGILESIV